MKKVIVLLLLFNFYSELSSAQDRIKDFNNIGWYSYFGENKLNKKFDLYTEYQWRRTHFITTWQQSVARGGINYHVTKNFSVLLGYTFFLTYPYGDHPTANTGYPIPEHRIFEDFKLKTPIQKFELEQRVRLEQRFVAKLAEGEGHKIQSWSYKNRVRYQLKVEFAIKGTTIDAKEPYLKAYEEIFIRFGQNTGKNFFDQNRIYAGIGYKVSDNLKFDAGYLFQLIKHGSKEKDTDMYVFEYNKGFSVSMYYDMNFVKKE